MSELIVIPTVEQINLEHQLANSKANEAVQHATNCGLMLLQVKASLQHGEWLPWLKQQQESGLIEFSDSTAKRYMRVAANRSRVTDLEAPSIRAALELLSDKEPTEQQGELIDGEVERQARIAAEQQAESERQARLLAEEDKAIWMQRNKEWQEQNKLDCSTIDALKRSLDAAKNQPTPKPVIVEKEVLPDDYEDTKKTAAKLKKDIDSLKKKQDELVNQRVESKIKEHENELVKVNRQVKDAEEKLESLQKHINSYSSIEHMTRLQRSQIERVRTVLVELAASMEGFSPLENDAETKRWWTLLADMLRNGAIAVDNFVNNEM